MSANIVFDKKLGFWDIFKASYSLYKQNFKQISLFTAYISFPLFILLSFIIYNVNPSQPIAKNSPQLFTYIGAIIDIGVIYIAYKLINNEPVKKISAFLFFFKKILKMISASVIGLLITALPTLIIVLPTVFWTAKHRVDGHLTVFASIVIAIVSMCYLVYFFIVSVYFSFIPLACIIRNKWHINAPKYSLSVVKKDFWKVLLLVIIMSFSYAVGSSLVTLFSAIGTPWLILLFINVAIKVALVYFDIVYLMYFLNLESYKKLDDKSYVVI